MKNSWIIVAGIVAFTIASCNRNETEELDYHDNESENQIPDSNSGAGYFLDLVGLSNHNSLSRNFWDESDSETPKFVWTDSDKEMKSFVFNDETLLDFVDGSKYSDVKVTGNKEIRNKCNLKLTTGLKSEYKNGYIIWCVTPVKDNEISLESENPEKITYNISVSMPDNFVYTSGQDNPTQHLSQYLFMSGSGKVEENKSTVNFDVIPSIIRFRIMNKDTETLELNDISLSGQFNNHLSMKYNPLTEKTDYNYSMTGKQHSIRLSCGDEGITVHPNKSVLLYALVFPTSISPENKISLCISSNYGRMESDTEYGNIFKNDGFISNLYYTINIPVTRRGITIETGNVDDFVKGDTCTVNIDKNYNY